MFYILTLPVTPETSANFPILNRTLVYYYILLKATYITDMELKLYYHLNYVATN